MKRIIEKAKLKYDFYETSNDYSIKIYNDVNPKNKLKVLDICCGLWSLINPWYKDDHNITLIELKKIMILYHF